MPFDNSDTGIPASWQIGASPTGAPSKIAWLELLFHYDLRRIGERTAAATLPDEAPVTVGRRSPLFVRSAPDGSSLITRDLEDTCVSREHLDVRFRPSSGSFFVTPNARARLPVERVFVDGPRAYQEITGATELPAGALVCIGRRVLLRLTWAEPAPVAGDPLAMLGNSEAMWNLRRQIQVAARFHTSNLLVVGETGSGKEHVARGLHLGSGARGQFIALNMSGVDPLLASAELFGHVRGAFTGAVRDESGAFADAQEGTLFLDEITDMHDDVQKKLLRVLDERRYSPIGSRASLPVTCRVVAAANRPIERLVEAGRFRLDLYERLRALTIAVPPLRDHAEDIPLLFRAFLEEQARAHPSLSRLFRDAGPTDDTPVPMDFFVELLRSPWPGNVRALRNLAVATAAANFQGTSFVAPPIVAAPPVTTRPAALDDEPGQSTSATSGTSGSSGTSGTSATSAPPDREALLAALEACDYQQSAVAARLGVARNTIIHWMEIHQIRRAKDLSDAEIATAQAECNGDLAATAKKLFVSLRSLKLRLLDRG